MESNRIVEAVVSDAIALAGIPAPAGAETDRIAWLENRLLAATGTRHRDGAGNLVWEFGSAPHDLALFVHVDTVFDASVEHRITRADGWLHGPGIGDNAIAVATTVAVTERLDLAPGAPFAVVFTVGEEGLGGLRGAKHACDTLRPCRVIALEGHGIDTVFADAVGSVRAALTITGPGGHSWWDRGRPSAVHALLAVCGQLADDLPAEAFLNLGIITGGSAVNAIAAEASVTLEVRSLEQSALAKFADTLAAIRTQAPLTIRVETLDARPAGRLDRTEPLLTTVLDVRRELGLATEVGDGSTDANAAVAAGIPALALGCVRGADMHSVTERIDERSIPDGLAQLRAVLERLLKNTESEAHL